jgi:hypothetical protein
MTTKRPSPAYFFLMCEEDLQIVAKARHGRPLLPEELLDAINSFNNGLDWYTTARIAVDLAIENARAREPSGTALLPSF